MPPRGYPGVFLAYASEKGAAFIDRGLYLPQEWTEDQERRAEAGIPAGVRFARKITLAARMLARAFAAGVPARWVVADSFSSRSGAFRHWLEEHGPSYAVMILRTNAIEYQGRRIRVEQLAERFVYEYDMGNFWQHDVRLEHAAQRAPVPFDPHKHYPVCTAGAGDCPPEDCGGPWGYEELMAERYSLLALLQLQDDQALIAQRLLDWYDGGPRPTYDDTEYMDALERMRDWLRDAPVAFNRRVVNVELRAQRKEWSCTSASSSSLSWMTARNTGKKSST